MNSLQGEMTEQVLDILKDSIIGICYVFVLIFLLYFVNFWEGSLFAKLICMIFNLKNKNRNAYIRVKIASFNLFTLKLHLQRVTYANTEMSIEIGDILIKFHFLKHVAVTSGEIFEELAGSKTESVAIPNSSLEIRLCGIEVHVYGRSVEDNNVEEIIKKKIEQIVAIPLIYQFVPSIEVDIKALRISVQNEYLRLALVCQFDQLKAIIGISSAHLNDDAFSYCCKFLMNEIELSFYENKDYLETKRKDENVSCYLLSNDFYIKFPIINVRQMVGFVVKEIGNYFTKTQLEETYSDDNSPSFHIALNLLNSSNNMCGSLNFGPWYLNELIIFLDFLLPNNFDERITVSSTDIERFCTSFEITAVCESEFTVCIPYYNEIITESVKKYDLLIAWKNALHNDKEYFKLLEEEEEQETEEQNINIDDDMEYPMLQKLFSKKQKVNKNEEQFYFSYELLKPEQIISETSYETAPHPGDFLEYNNALGCVLNQNSSVTFRKEFRYAHEEEIEKNGIAVIVRAPLIKIKTSTVKTNFLCANDVQFLFKNGTCFYTVPKERMEIAVTCRDLLFDLNKPALDGILSLVSYFSNESEVEEFYRTVNLPLPRCELDDSYLRNRLERIIYLSIINAEISSNIASDLVVDNLEHINALIPSQAFLKASNQFINWIIEKDVNKEYLQMFNYYEEPYYSLLFSDTRIVKEEIPEFDIFSESENINIMALKRKYLEIENDFYEYTLEATTECQDFKTNKASHSLYPRLLIECEVCNCEAQMNRQIYANKSEVALLLGKEPEHLDNKFEYYYDMNMEFELLDIALSLEFAYSSELAQLLESSGKKYNDLKLAEVSSGEFKIQNLSAFDEEDITYPSLLSLKLSLDDPVIIADFITVQAIIFMIFNEFVDSSYYLSADDICRFNGLNCLFELLSHINEKTIEQTRKLSTSFMTDTSTDEEDTEHQLKESNYNIIFSLDIQNALLLIKQIPIGQLATDDNKFDESKYFPLQSNSIELILEEEPNEVLVDIKISPIKMYDSIFSKYLQHSFIDKIEKQKSHNNVEKFSIFETYYDEEHDEVENSSKEMLLLGYINLKISVIKELCEEMNCSHTILMQIDVGNLEINITNVELPMLLEALQCNLIVLDFQRRQEFSAEEINETIRKLYANRGMLQCSIIHEERIRLAKEYEIEFEHQKMSLIYEKALQSYEYLQSVIIEPSSLEVSINEKMNESVCLEFMEQVVVKFDNLCEQQLDECFYFPFAVSGSFRIHEENNYENIIWKFEESNNSYYEVKPSKRENMEPDKCIYYYNNVYDKVKVENSDFEVSNWQDDIVNTQMYEEYQEKKVTNVKLESESEEKTIRLNVVITPKQMIIYPKFFNALELLLIYDQSFNTVYDLINIFFNKRFNDEKLTESANQLENKLREEFEDSVHHKASFHMYDTSLVEQNNFNPETHVTKELELVLQKKIHYVGNYFENTDASSALKYFESHFLVKLGISELEVQFRNYEKEIMISVDAVEVEYKHVIKNEVFDECCLELLRKCQIYPLTSIKKQLRSEELVKRNVIFRIGEQHIKGSNLLCKEVLLEVQEFPEKNKQDLELKVLVSIEKLSLSFSVFEVLFIQKYISSISENAIQSLKNEEVYDERINEILKRYIYNCFSMEMYQEYYSLCFEYDKMKNDEFIEQLFKNAVEFLKTNTASQKEIYSDEYLHFKYLMDEYGISEQSIEELDNLIFNKDDGLLFVEIEEQKLLISIVSDNKEIANTLEIEYINISSLICFNEEEGYVINGVIKMEEPYISISDELFLLLEELAVNNNVYENISTLEVLSYDYSQIAAPVVDNDKLTGNSYQEEIYNILKESHLSFGRKLLKMINYCKMEIIMEISRSAVHLVAEELSAKLSIENIYLSLSAEENELYPTILNKFEIPLIECVIFNKKSKIGGFKIVNLELETKSKVYNSQLKTHVQLNIEGSSLMLPDISSFADIMCTISSLVYKIKALNTHTETLQTSIMSFDTIPLFVFFFSMQEIEVTSSILDTNELVISINRCNMYVDASQNYMQNPISCYFSLFESEVSLNQRQMQLPTISCYCSYDKSHNFNLNLFFSFRPISIFIDELAILSTIQVNYLKYELLLKQLKTNHEVDRNYATNTIANMQRLENNHIYIESSNIVIEIGISNYMFCLATLPIICEINVENGVTRVHMSAQQFEILQSKQFQIKNFEMLKIDVLSHNVTSLGVLGNDDQEFGAIINSDLEYYGEFEPGKGGRSKITIEQPTFIIHTTIVFAIEENMAEFKFVKESIAGEQEKVIDSLLIKLKEFEHNKLQQECENSMQMNIMKIQTLIWPCTNLKLTVELPDVQLISNHNQLLFSKNGKQFILDSSSMTIEAKNILISLDNGKNEEYESTIATNIYYHVEAKEESKSHSNFVHSLDISNLTTSISSSVCEQLFDLQQTIKKIMGISPTVDQQIIDKYQESQSQSELSANDDEENQFCIYFEKADYTKTQFSIEIFGMKIKLKDQNPIFLELPEIKLLVNTDKKPYGNIQDYQTEEQYDGIMDIAETFNIFCFIFYQPFEFSLSVVMEIAPIALLIPYQTLSFIQESLTKIQFANNYLVTHKLDNYGSYNFENLYLNNMQLLQKELRRVYQNQQVFELVFTLESIQLQMLPKTTISHNAYDNLPMIFAVMQGIVVSYLGQNNVSNVEVKAQHLLLFLSNYQFMQPLRIYEQNIGEYPLPTLPLYINVGNSNYSCSKKLEYTASETLILNSIQNEAIDIQLSPYALTLISELYYYSQEYISSIGAHLGSENSEKKELEKTISKNEQQKHISYIISFKHIDIHILSTRYSESLENFEFNGTDEQILQNFVKIKQINERERNFLNIQSSQMKPFINIYANFTNQYIEQINTNFGGLLIQIEENTSNTVISIKDTFLYIENYISGMLLSVQMSEIIIKHFESSKLLMDVAQSTSNIKFETVGEDNSLLIQFGELQGKISISVVEFISRLIENKSIEFEQQFKNGKEYLEQSGILFDITTSIENENLSVEQLKKQLKSSIINSKISMPKEEKKPLLSYLESEIIIYFEEKGQSQIDILVPIINLQFSEYSLEDIISISVKAQELKFTISSVSEVGQYQLDHVPISEVSPETQEINNSLKLVTGILMEQVNIELQELEQNTEKLRISEILKLNNTVYNITSRSSLKPVVSKAELLYQELLDIHSDPGEIMTGENLLLASQMIQSFIRDIINFINTFKKENTNEQLLKKLQNKQKILVDGLELIEESNDGVLLRKYTVENVEELLPTLDLLGKCTGFVDMFTKNVKSVQNSIGELLNEMNELSVKIGWFLMRLGDYLSSSK